MKAPASRAPKEKSPAQQIGVIIKGSGDWRGKKLSRLRALIKKADPGVVEEVKWKKPSKPLGVPVWSHDGIICIGDTLKNAVRLTFPNGAQAKDPKKLFNTRLESRTVRAIDFHEGDIVDAVVSSLSTTHTSAAKTNACPGLTAWGVFSRHHFAAAGFAPSSADIASMTETAYP